jgi:hypothetical protein
MSRSFSQHPDLDLIVWTSVLFLPVFFLLSEIMCDFSCRTSFGIGQGDYGRHVARKPIAAKASCIFGGKAAAPSVPLPVAVFAGAASFSVTALAVAASVES